MDRTEPLRSGVNDYALILAVIGDGTGVAGLGAERRANAFLDWVASPFGGGLPGNHIHALIGETGTIGRASLRQMLSELIPDLDDRIQHGGAAGRRCYVYLAGQAVDLGQEIRLLARDDSGRPLILDASLQQFTNYLTVRRIFDEVVTIADVGVSELGTGSVQMPVFPEPEPAPRVEEADVFVALSAARGDTLRARDDADERFGAASLGFTGAIIGALSGGARDDSQAITAESLISYVGARLTREWGSAAEMPHFQSHASRSFELFAAPPTDERARFPNAYALLIGIDKYRTIPGLDTCASDARALAGVLADPLVGGYPRENVHLITNYSATRAEVVNALAQLAVAGEDATVLVYFSGRASAENGDITLWCSDDNLSSPTDVLTASKINGILDSFVSKNVVLMLDTSEGAAGITASRRRMILSSTLPGEAAYMSEGYGEFTLRVLQGLQGAAGAGDDLTVFDLFEFAHAEVVARGQQHPTIVRDPSTVDFVIAKRPLDPAYSNNRVHGAPLYAVHVVFSLKSPRAEFVEHVLLPALRAADLVVVTSEPLETSPVGRVMGVDRGIRFARKTLMLVTPALQSEFQYGVVVDSLYTSPPLLQQKNLVVVDLEPGVDDVGQGMTWEEFDLIAAKTARHSSVKRLIDRLRDAPDESTATAPTAPVIEIADDRDRVTRDPWLLDPQDSEWVMKLASSVESPHASSTLMMHPGDVAFARDQTDASRTLGMTKVNRAFKSRVSPTPTGRVRSYQLERPLRFEIPKSLEYVLAKGSTDEPQMGAALLEPMEARLLAAMCVASNPLAADRIAGWMGEGIRGFVLDACTEALHWNSFDRDHVLPGLLPHLASEDLAPVFRAALEDGSVHHGPVARSLVRFIRQTRPEDLPLVANLLRAADDAGIRALASTIDGSTHAGERYAYSAFIDISADVSTYGDVASRVADELVDLGFGQAIVEASPTDGPETGERIRNSACVVFGGTRGAHAAATIRRQYLATLNAEQRTRLFTRADVAVPKTVVLLDPLRESHMDRRHLLRLPVTGLDENSEGAYEAAAGRVLDVVLAACQSLNEAAVHPPMRSRPEAIGCVEIEIGDLLATSADAIVNAVGVSPTLTGVIGRQLFERLGGRLSDPLERAGSLDNGETVLVETNAHIAARYVINTCTEKSESVNTAKSVARGVNGAILCAEGQPDVQSIAFPALGSGASNLDASDVAREVLPTVLAWLEGGTFIKTVKFVFNNESIAAVYREVLDELRVDEATRDNVQNATRWFVSLRQTSPGSVLVGGDVALGIFFARDSSPGAVALDVPYTALELTIYVDAGAAFHLEGPSQLTVQTREGQLGVESIPVTILALTDGDHPIRISLAAPGARSPSELTQTVSVEAAVSLPDIPELIDPRAMPTPEPDFVLFVAFEETQTTEKIRLHVTSPALGLRRHRMDQPLFLGKTDVATIQRAAADVAADVDTMPPPEARAALQRFGAMLYDVLMPPAHELRDFVTRLFLVPQRPGRPLTWLVVSDEAASLPWEMVCPYGFDATYTRRYGDFLAGWFAIAQWIGRRGFELATEVPMGPIGIVHYGQQAGARAQLRDALGDGEASDVDRTRGLDILQPGSPYFGVHLLRFSDPSGSTEITEAGRASNDAALDGDRRLDFTLRRPLVTLSLVDAALEANGPTGARFTNLDGAWAIPMLLARVSAVVGPRWTTSPGGDRTFYRAFYDALRADRPVAVALWEARMHVRAAHPNRADWLSYIQFGHPAAAPYPVDEAEGFAMFEPIGVDEDDAFIAGRTYAFRASFRADPPAWFDGRRRRRVARFDGSGTRLLVDAPFERGAKTYDLVRAGGADGDDYYCVFELTMPRETGTHDVFIQFARGREKLRSTFIPFAVVDAVSDSAEIPAEARSV